jgi:GntR family transcriptional regulator, transcriptional repressor for pyruvate dehydrogenase complex
MTAIEPPSDDRPTLSAQVAQHLLELIDRDQLRAGDRVPSEVQIGRDLQVSRGSVREAYRTLAALGILDIETGRKPRLRPLDARALTKIFDYAVNTAQVTPAHVSQMRRAIESQTAQLAARFASAAQRRRLRELMQQMRASGPDHTERAAGDSAIHALIAQASGNPLHLLLLSALQPPPESRTATGWDRVLDGLEVLVGCICAGDAIGAAAAMSFQFDASLLPAERRTDPGGGAPDAH